MSAIYGPVPSRRLGRSLGVDVVPYKTCTFDCIYCQLGRTTDKTLTRHTWSPVETIVDELKEHLASNPDYITLGGSGEPTLYADLGSLIDAIRSLTNIPVAVLTNGSLLWRADVRQQLRAASLVLPSLDAGNAKMFWAINRPHEDLDFDRFVDGLVAFRREFPGPVWLEVPLRAVRNSIRTEVRDIAACVGRIRPDRVQLNTATRPPVEAYAAALASHRLQQLAGKFPGPVEVIGDALESKCDSASEVGETAVLELVRRRPCTPQQVSQALHLHPAEGLKYLTHLHHQRQVERRRAGGRIFYVAARTPPTGEARTSESA